MWNKVDKMLMNARIERTLNHIPRNMVVADIGCGYHFQLIHNIQDHIKFGYGFDFQVINYKSDKMLIKNVNLVKQKLPLDDYSVDVVTMLAVIEHFDEKESDFILKEVKRVLRVDGGLIITTPTPPAKPILEFCCKTGIFKNKDAMEHKIYYDKDNLINKLKEHSFDVLVHEYFQFGLNQMIVAKRS